MGRGCLSKWVLVCIILYRVNQCLTGLQSAKIQKKSFQAIDFPFPFSSVLCRFITLSTDLQPHPPPALRKRNKAVLANRAVNICMDLCFTLPEIWQRRFICLYKYDKTLNIRPQIQTPRPRCWNTKKKRKQMRALLALFYWLLDFWLAPLCGVHLLKEDRAKHCSSAYWLSGGIKGFRRQSAHQTQKFYAPQNI